MENRQILSNIYNGLYSRCSALEKIAKRLRGENKRNILDEIERIADIMSDVDWLIDRIDERNAEQSNDEIVFTIKKYTGNNMPRFFNNTYKIITKNNRFNKYNKYVVKDLFKDMSELTTVFNNNIKKEILFEIKD